MNTVESIFMGWDKPALLLAVEYLSQFYVGGKLDLSGCLLVVPTQHAGRRLREELAAHAAERGGAVLGGQFITPDQLAPAVDAADSSYELAAWLRCLQELGAETPSLLPSGISHFTFEGMLGLAERIMQLRGLLCDEGLLIRDVVKKRDVLVEPQRWDDLAKLEEHYLSTLNQWRCCDRSFVRLQAADNPEFDAMRVLLLFVTDLPPIALRALENITLPVTALVRAPQALVERFGCYGTPLVDFWQEWNLNLSEQQMIVCSTPRELVGAIEHRFVQDDERSGVSIGVPDSELLPAIKGMLKTSDLHGFDPAGESIAEHALFGLLSLIGEVISDSAFDTLAALLRHPDLLDYLARNIDDLQPVSFLVELDQFQQKHLPLTVDLNQLEAASSVLHSGIVEVLGWLEPLSSAPLSDALPALLHKLYEGAPKKDDAFGEVAEAVMKQLVSFKELEALLILEPEQRFRLFLRLLNSVRRYDQRRLDSMDLLGWVELAWEDASVLLVAGMHEQVVPESVTGDLFLPDRARSELGLRDNRYLFARDLYMMQSILASRPAGQTLFYTSRTALSGDSLNPSRLLFQCADVDLPQRVNWLFEDVCPEVICSADAGEGSAFKLNVERVDAPNRISVTAFRDYLQCPFRYYLSRHLKMNQRVDPRKMEMDALDFGNRTHEALEALFKKGPKNSTKPGEVADFLISFAEASMKQWYSDQLSVPLMIQQQSLFQRLRAAADVHASEVRAGWHMKESEFRICCRDFFPGVELTGIVDRIDEHEDGRIRVLDYKTFEKPKSPFEGHIIKAREESPTYALCAEGYQWIDLQLPLYALLLQSHFSAEISCGYFVLPKAVRQTGVLLFDQMGDHLPSAQSCAKTIIERIQQGTFWPPNQRIRYDDFASIVPYVEGLS